MVKRKSQLVDEINKLGLGTQLVDDIKYRNRDLVKILGDYYLTKKDKPSFGLLKRWELESLQLCARFTDLREAEQLNLFDSSDYIAEDKKNGCRLIACYTPDEGFSFLSRNISDIDFLPLEYTDKILHIRTTPDTKEQVVKYNKDFVGKFKYSFIIDLEVIAQGNIDTSLFSKYGTVTESEQNATSAILGIEDIETCHLLQTDQAPLEFFCFDILYFNDKWCLDLPLLDRQKLFRKIVGFLKISGINIDVLPQYVTKAEKEAAWQNNLNNKGEGLVFKNLTKSYYATEARKKDVQVKLKRSMGVINQMVNDTEDIDAFITGVTKGSKGSGFENSVGSVEFSVNLLDEFFNETQHVIANVSGIPKELRDRLGVRNPDGSVSLNPEFQFKVCVINGMSVSPKNLRFSHATCGWEFRSDKSPEDCKLTKLFLLNNII